MRKNWDGRFEDRDSGLGEAHQRDAERARPAQTVMESSAAAIALAKKAVAKVNGERELFCSTILFVVWH